MIFGPVLGYIPQYLTIKSSKNTQGFSLLVPLILLTANVTRIFYWYGKRFDVTLLYQSIVMIIAQMALVELIVRCKRQTAGVFYHDLSQKPGDIMLFDLEPRYFGNTVRDLIVGTSPFRSYVGLIAGQVTVFGILSSLLIGYKWYVETIGYIALGIESMLGVPQFLRNMKNKSVVGLSGILIFSLFTGDLFKMGFFIYTESPLQFILCAAFQLCCDVAILYQFHAYRRPLVISLDSIDSPLPNKSLWTNTINR